MAEEPVQSVETPMKEAGSTWLTFYEQRCWPTVICDHSSAPALFLEGRRSSAHMPAILLGKHKYIWVTHENTEEYDPNFAYVDEPAAGEQIEIYETDDKDTMDEKQRRIAFTQDAREFQNDKWWSNYIEQQSQARKLQGEMNARSAKASTKKSKRTITDHDCEIIGAKRRSQSSSESSEHSVPRFKRTKLSGHTHSQQLLTPKSTPNGKLLNSTGIIEISDQEVSDDEDSIFVADSNKSQDPFMEDSLAGKHKRARGRPSSADWAPPTMTDKECRILLGSNGQSVIVCRARCAESEYLKSLEHHDEKRGEHIIDLNGDKRAVQLDLTHAELTAIWDYLWNGDFGPEYLKDPDDYQPFGNLSDARKEKAAQKLAYAFVTASKIQLITLQDLIEKKLNALYPLSSMALLIVAVILTRAPREEVHTEPEEKVANWLIGSIAGQFWNLAKNHTGALQRLLHDNDDLREAVYHKMQINADEGMEGCEEL